MPQGTVKSYDPASHESVILTDDLVEHPVDSDTFRASTLLEMRIGQRVRFEFSDADDGPRITNLGLVSI